MTKTENVYVTIPEYAKLAGVSRQAVHARIGRKTIAHKKVFLTPTVLIALTPEEYKDLKKTVE